MSPTVSSFPLNLTTHQILDGTLVPTGLYWNFPRGPIVDTMSPAMYPMALPFGGVPLMGVAMLQSYDDVLNTAKYEWFNSTIVDAGIFNPAFKGMGLNVTVNTTQKWLVDIFSGAVLDTNITMLVYNGPLLAYEIEIRASPETLGDLALANQVMLWSMLPHDDAGVPVVSIEVSLYAAEGAMAAAQAAALSNALLVADGVEPALDMSIRFDASTIEQQKGLVTATKANLALLAKLKMAWGLKGLLASKGNQVAYIYYAQVPLDVDENKGSVKYWGDFAKEKEEQMTLFGTTIPLALFALAVILVIAAISFFLMKPKEELEEE
jgi:hypothetical protein